MRNRLRVVSIVLFLLFFVVAVGGGLFWGNLNFTRQAPGGVDFIVLWRATRNFVMDGVTPYGEWTALEIQNIIYGHQARFDQNPYRPNMPLYSVLFFVPLGWINNFVVSRSLWMMVLEVAAAGQVFASLAISRWRPSWLYMTILLLFSLFWFPAVDAILAGNSILLQSVLIFGAIKAIDQQSDELGGALAALALINIEATGFVLFLIGFWAVTANRWRIIGGFFMMMTLLGALAFLLYPAWFLPFLRAIWAIWQVEAYPSTFSVLTAWFPGIGIRLAQILLGLAITVMFVEWNAVRGKDPRWLYWTASMTAVVTPLLGIETAPGWIAFSLPALILVVSVMEQRWGLLGRLTALLVVLVLFFGLWTAYLNGVEAVFVLFYPIFMSLMLYWVRWWATRPPRLWADMVAQGN